MNREKKFAEGPWFQEEGLKIFATGSKGLFNVADARGWGYFTGKGSGALGLDEDEAIRRQTANAHLIAAAPELLEALEGLLVLCECEEIEDSYTDIMKAKAAIAKAYGESQ